MIVEQFSVLLITKDVNKYQQIKILLNQSQVFIWEIDWINNFTTALIGNQAKKYDCFILECDLDQVTVWVDRFKNIPLIFITNSVENGLKSLDFGVEDYWLEDKLDCYLIENNLRLIIQHNRTKIYLKECSVNQELLYHQQIEQKRNQPEILLNTIFENIPNGLLILDQNGQIVLANRKATELFNKSLKDLIGYNFGIPILKKESTELQIIQADQQFKTVEIYVGDTQWNQEKAYVVIMMDITDRKIIENELKNNHLKLQLITENIPASLAYIDQEQKYQFVNYLYAKMFEKTPQEIIGETVKTILGETNYLAIEKNISQSLGGETLNYEQEIILFDTLKYFKIQYVPHFEGKKVLGFFAFILDVTKEKENEFQLIKSEQRYRYLYENTPVMLHSIDQDGNLLNVSNKWLEVLGYTREEVIGQKSVNFLTSTSKQYAINTVIPLFKKQGYAKDIAYQFIKKDGTIVDILLSSSCEKDDQGNFLRSLAVLEDVTEKNELAKQVNEYQQNLEKLVEERTKSLKESEAKNKALLQAIPDLMFRIAKDGTYLDFYTQNIDDLYLDPLFFLGKKFTDLMPLELVEKARIAHDKALNEGTVEAFEYELNIHGETHYYENRVVANGENEVLAIIRDITEQKIAQLEREKAEKRLLTAQKIAQLGNWDWNMITGEIDWSDEIYHIFGRAKDHFIPTYQNFLKCVHPEDLQMVIDAINYSLENDCAYSVDHRIILPDGTCKIVHEQGDIIYNGENRPFHMIGTVQDITQRKQVEQALRESESRLEEAQKVAHIGSYEYDLETGKIEWSKELYRLYDLDPSQPPPSFDRHLKRIHPEDRLKTQPLFEQLINNGISYQFDYRILLPNGIIRYAEARGKPIFDQHGKLIKVFGTALDITQRKQTEFALRESEERFRVIFEQAGIGMSICNLGGQFLQVNSTLAQIVGYSIPELLDRNIHDITAVKYRATQKNKLRQLILGRSNNFSIEKYYICKDGSICWVNAIVSLTKDSQGNPKNLIYVVEDITERKKAKIQLEQAKEKAEAANHAKSQFLANMSHELRTPLNAILGFTQLMSRSANLSQTYQEYIQIINRSGEHLLSLINDILDLSKIEAGQLQTTQESFNLFSLLDEVQQLFSLKALSKDLQLNFERESNVPQYIKCDQKKLRSILINLLGNAIKFTDQGGIWVKIKSEEIFNHDRNIEENLINKYHIFFEIQDTGIGILPSEIDSLFDVFVQSQSGKKQAEGTGLGLPISKHFVEMMGGKINLKSTEGEGSIFTFDIFCESTNIDEIGQTTPKYQIIGLDLLENKKYPSLLIVEDQWTNCELLLNILQPLGFLINTAENGEKGIKEWENSHPDLILMDIRMPMMDGYEATREIRWRESLLKQKDPSFSPVPIIALTASVFDSQRELLLEVGCTDFIPKPLDANKLLEKIGLYLGIDYIYQEIQPDLLQFSQNQVNICQLNSSDLVFMSTQWREKLKLAAISARCRQISSLIEEIPPQYGDIKKGLIDLVNHLNYDKIVELAHIND